MKINLKNGIYKAVIENKKALYTILAVIVVMVITISVIVVLAAEKQVTVTYDGKVQSATTYKKTVGEVLRELKITYSPDDKVIPSVNTTVVNGMNIVIKRAVPVTLTVDGKVQQLMTAADKVGDIFAEKNIAVSDMDKIEPSRDTEVKPNMMITVKRVKEEIVTQKVVTPYKVIKRETDTLDKGQTRVIQEGQNEEKEIKYKLVYEDNKLIAKIPIEEKVISPLINKIVLIGTAGVHVTSRGEVIRYSKELTMIATAYDLSYESTGKRPGDKYYGITYSGIPARQGVVAVDPSVIPLGTRLYVEGYGYAIAADTGSAIKGNRIDLFYEDSKKARSYGMKKVKVYILK